MKRWNQKGSVFAKTRMAELRGRKARIALDDLKLQFRAKFPTRDWYAELSARGPLPTFLEERHAIVRRFLVEQLEAVS